AAATKTAIAAADTTLAQLTGVYCVGAATNLPRTVEILATHLDGAPVTRTPDPDTAAVLGAVHATTNTTTPPPPQTPARPWQRWRRILTAIAPLAALGA